MTLIIGFFVFTFVIVWVCVGFGFSFFKRKQTQQLRSMLRKAEATDAEQRNPELLLPPDRADALARLLDRFRITEQIDLMIDQAGSSSNSSKLLLSCVIAAIVGGVLGSKFHFSLPAGVVSPVAALVGLVLPFLMLLHKRKKCIADFEEQFPEALDFLSRSMRAGHGFSVALEMLATDVPDPLGRAFRRVSNDTALGSPLDVALGKLMILVPLVDVRFFVSSVILQQETGGNLGEILNKLAYIIRERFRLKGQVKAVSAHGRVTGFVLLIMPIGVAGFMLITNPSYLTQMTLLPLGRMMIYGAIGGQIVAYFVIKKIIDIKV